MLWVLLVSSVIGFFAANAVVTHPTFLSFSQFFAGQLDSLIWLQYASSAAVVIMLVSMWWRSRYHSRRCSQPNRNPLGLAIRLVVYLLLSGLTLTASLTHGLLDYYDYQSRLLKQPVTLDVTITPAQISDSVADTLLLTDKSIQLGSTNSRQVWQIIPSDAENGDSLTSDKFLGQLPINVWVSANMGDHPEWQTTLNQLRPGQQLAVKLELTPIEQPQYQSLPTNAQAVSLGFDTALWLRQRDIQATAQLVEIDADSMGNVLTTTLRQKIVQIIEEQRWQLRQHVLSHLKNSLSHTASTDEQSAKQTIASHAILLGLLTGDKALMNADIKQLYQVTGISHLLAISGPHVTLLASIVALALLELVKRCYPTLLLRIPSRLLMLWVSVVVAGIYALLVGFELPAQRTFWLLLLVTLATQWLITTNPYRLLAWIGLLMIWLDSTAVLQAGFWLSFVAVGLLLRFSEQHSVDASEWQSRAYLPTNLLTHLWQAVKSLLWLQLWLFVLMMPVVVWFFGQVSLIGMLVNLIAVPLLGLVVVPINIAAGLLSLMPGVGYWLSAPLWSLLVGVLNVFHAGLAALLNSGFAKPVFLTMAANQLVLLAIAILLLLSRGVLPRLVALPLLVATIAIPIERHQSTEQAPQLTVLNHAQFGIALLVKGDNAWLILSDNRNLLPKQPSNGKNPFKKNQSTPVINDASLVASLLNDSVYPLLASQHIGRLTGVISQTPSITSHDMIQRLAASVPIKQYWQAGFDPVQPMQDSHGQNVTYPYISAKPCQLGQQWTEQGLTLSALTGWTLNLPSEQLTQADKLAAQTCFIQIEQQADTAYQTVIAAGRDALPMQMATQLCQVMPIQQLVAPYALPLDNTWLMQTSPNQIHSLTGRWDYQRLSESNRFQLSQLERKLGQANKALTITEAHQVGPLRYTLSDTKQRPSFTGQ